MSALTIEGTMLYCPKCQSKYEDGSQRFCNNDGGRLLPVKSSKSGAGARSGGVFTNLLGRSTPRNDKDERLSSKPRFKRSENAPVQFQTPSKSKIFKSDPLEELENNSVSSTSVSAPIVAESSGKHGKAPVSAKSPSKVIQSSQVPMSQAKLGDRKTDPEGRAALTWQNPSALLGQIIKGRYHVAEKLHQDQTSIAYLAEDGIVKGKKVVVRVLMQETAADNFQEKVFAEERVSLSHVNHPNIASVIDSGELPEGKAFIITEYISGESVADVLRKTDEINPMRTARIIRQTSLALSSVHQNGILHRDLKPENILLTVTDSGVEQVKVADFCVSDGKPRIDNLGYKSPEQLGRQLPSYASDSYSLAVTAHQMLTGQLPYSDSSERSLIKAQKAGLKIKPSDLREDLSPLLDNILAKGLSYNPADRYPRARDFGEALFNALASDPAWDKSDKTHDQVEADSGLIDMKRDPGTGTAEVLAGGLVQKAATDSKSSAISSDFQIASSVSAEEAEDLATDGAKENEEALIESGSDLWKRRSPASDSEKGWLPTILYSIVLLGLIAATIWAIAYFINRPEPAPELAVETKERDPEQNPTIKDSPETASNADEIEVPPPAREISPPEGFTYFENSKQNLSKELTKNYRGFSLYFPDTWEKTDSKTNFVDVSKKDENGLPKEQILITHYPSRGTFDADRESFTELVDKSNADLKKIIPKYEVESAGKIEVNNGWKSYEVKFKGKSDIKGGENFEIWGRRIWIPAARPGETTGFVITMLATSLSSKIESLDDVGKKGELGDILSTFEPDREYN